MQTFEILNLQSITAGILIGLGVIINTLTTVPILGAFLFSFGLLTIIALNLPLYTGRIGFIKKDWIIPLIIILVSNLIGIALCTSLYGMANPTFWNTLFTISIIKFNKTYLEMFIYGIFCGILIHFAVKTKEKPYLTSMAVILFILMGAEHCIADFPYLIINFNFVNLIKFILVIIGNSIGAIILEKGLIKPWKDTRELKKMI